MKISIQKIKCIKETRGLGDDEIYAVVLIKYRLNGQDYWGPISITQVETDVKDGAVFYPVFNDGKREIELPRMLDKIKGKRLTNGGVRIIVPENLKVRE